MVSDMSSSKFSRVFFRPALDHYFLVGVKLDGVAPLAVQHAKEAVFPPTEWKIGHRCGHSDIDSNIAGGSFVAKTSCRRTARREERRLVAIRAALEKRQGFVHVIGMDKAQHRTKNLRV